MAGGQAIESEVAGVERTLDGVEAGGGRTSSSLTSSP